MNTKSPLLWLQSTDTDVWWMVMIELVKCRKKKVNDEFEQKWKEFKTTKDSRYDYVRWSNSRNYIKFITKYRYYICDSELIDYEFRTKLFVYGFEIVIIEPEEHDYNIYNNSRDLIYYISHCYNLETKLQYLIKYNNEDEILNIYSNDYFKFICLQEEKDNSIVYCGLEERYIKEYRVR